MVNFSIYNIHILILHVLSLSVGVVRRPGVWEHLFCVDSLHLVVVYELAHAQNLHAQRSRVQSPKYLLFCLVFVHINVVYHHHVVARLDAARRSPGPFLHQLHRQILFFVQEERVGGYPHLKTQVVIGRVSHNFVLFWRRNGRRRTAAP